MRYATALALFCALPSASQTIDWSKIGEEGMRHFQSLVQIDSTGAPGAETKVAEYVKKVLEGEGIPVTLVAKDPARANLIARIKGNGSKKPLLIMGHSDTVKVDLSKWTFPPFSATRSVGIGYLVSEHFPEIEAETCLAEGGGVARRAGTVRYAMIQTMEKRPSGA